MSSGEGRAGKVRLGVSLGLIASTVLALATVVEANHTGAHTFATDCDLSGCHASGANLAFHNGAGAANIIDYAISQGMTGLPSGPTSQIASYIASILPAIPNQNVAFNSGSPVTSTTLVLPDLHFSTSWGALTSATGANGSNGTVSFPAGAGTTRSATFTPTACLAGTTGTFTFRGTGPGGNTSTRTQTVDIGFPTVKPVFTAAAPPAGQTGVAYSSDLAITICDSLATYSLQTGTLPPGLSLDTNTGTISGTPTTTVGSPFTGTIRASYPGGQFSTPDKSFSIAITLGPPVVNSVTPAPFAAVGVPYSGYTITATNSPTSFGGTGLPPGLSVVPGTGAITGTPTSAAGSPYTANLTATNGTATGNKNVVFNVVPDINSAATAFGQTGVAFSYQVTGAAGPAYTSYAALDPLPAGLSIAPGTGLISGTPTVVGGPTNVRLTGSTAFGTSAQFTLAITIGLGPPVITNAPLTATGGEAIVFTPFQITATNPPHTAFGATGLPPGLVVSPTGLITGTPDPGSAGLYPVNISATNATATGNATLNITISQFPPVNTSLAPPAGQTGVPYSFQITANNGPTSFNAANLPPGLTVNTGTGLISGIPTAVGNFNTATITSANGSGSDTDVVTFNITLGPPVISSPATAGGAVGFAFSYQIVATNSPTLYAISNIPPGLSLDTATGLLSGSPTTNGTYAGTMSATNATATATVPLTITIAVGIPVVTSASATGATGSGFSYQVVATNGPTSYSATGLPAGLSINTTTGRITGTPTASGTFVVNLGATNGTGTGTGTLTLNIALSPPTTANGSATFNTLPGQSFQYTVAADNGPFTFSSTALPAGLVLDTSSGIINGTILAPAGTYDVVITITNATGTTTFNLRIIVGYVVARSADGAFEVPFETATALALPAIGDVVTVNIVTLPAHGLLSTQPNSKTVTYTPAAGYSGSDSFTYSVTNPAGTSAVSTINILVGDLIPVAGPGSVTVPLNTPTAIDMSKLARGSGLTGVAITTSPTHGTATVNGLSITYTPRHNYFGPDSFQYVAFGNAGSSAPATVQVEVTGRPDPTTDREVLGLVDAQSQAARRFSAAQAGNYQRRMESLHFPLPAQGPTAAAVAQRTTPAPARMTPAFGVAEPAPESSPLVPISLVQTLMNVVTSRSLDVSATSAVGGGGVPATFTPQTSLWVAGTANFGNRNATAERDRLRFSTDGVSAGVDRRFSQHLAGGVGVGYGHDESDVGESSRLKARATSVAGYASYQPAPRLFIDMLVGYGQLRFDTRRYVEAPDQNATARRKGSQVFGSLGASYDARKENLLVSPYGRIDFSADRLDAVNETGAGNYALRYEEARQRSVQVAAGLRAESKHATEFGFAVPRARVEYRRELQDERAVRLSYADLVGGPEYTITPAGISRNSLLLGVGVDLAFGGGLRVGIDYTAQRASGASNVQGIRLLVTQELDVMALPGWRWEPTTFGNPVNVDAGFSWDDNVTRGREAGDKLTDRAFTLGISQTHPFRLNANTRFTATALANAEKFDRYAGLGRFAAGAQGEVQYRTSGAFDAVTFGFVGRAMYEKYESSLRTGPRYFAGVNARRAITDRIEAFAEAGANIRNARSDVFTWRDWSAKLNLDWSIGKGLVYVTGEYRKGDTVSSGHPSLVNIGLTEVFSADDAFEAQDLVSYRFDARTVIGTLGYNHPLGARDSIDFSWRRIEATPTRKPSFDFTGPTRYIDNQYSIVYLMRF